MKRRTFIKAMFYAAGSTSATALASYDLVDGEFKKAPDWKESSGGAKTLPVRLLTSKGVINLGRVPYKRESSTFMSDGKLELTASGGDYILEGLEIGMPEELQEFRTGWLAMDIGQNEGTNMLLVNNIHIVLNDKLITVG